MPKIRAYPQSPTGGSLGAPRDFEVAQIPHIGEHIDLDPRPGSVHEVTAVLHTPLDKEKIAALIWARLDSDFIGPK